LSGAWKAQRLKAGLDGNIVSATQLEEIAAKPAKK
jgi:hypothetical protein